MTVRLPFLLVLSLSLGAACSSAGSLQDSAGGARGGSAGSQSGAGGGGGGTGGQSGAAGGGAGGAVPSALEITGLAYGNGTFVAVGAERQNAALWTGVIYASADGAAWTRVAGGLAGQPHDVKFGNGKFVTIESFFSDSGVYPPKALVSDDGRAWTTTGDLPDGVVAERIAFGAGTFVTGGRSSHLRSTDGVTWTPFGPAASSYLASAVDFAGGRFVSWTKWENDVAVYDGSVWSSSALPDAKYMFDDLRVVNDRFVAVARYDCCFGEQPSQIRWGTASSADGSTWAFDQFELTAAPSQIVHDSGTICIGFRDWDLLSGATCDSLVVTFHDNNFRPEALLSAGGIFIASGIAGILTSSDGRVWTKRL